MKNISLFFSLFLLQAMIAFTIHPAHAGGQTVPPTLSESLDLGMVETLHLTHTKADIAENRNSAHGLPEWAGFSLTTFITPAISGNVISWPDGGKSWTMRATSPGAPALSLVFEDVQLAPQSVLFVYSESNPTQYFAIKAEEIQSGYISTPPAIGDAVIIEYYEPNATQNLQGSFAMTDLVILANGYEAFHSDEKDLGSADWCLININCEEGDNWQGQKRGVARLLLRVTTNEGIQWGWCSGSLVNNTAQDGTPYFLTADHCGYGATATDRNLWQFFFNFERPGCENAGNPPSNVIIGCQLIARAPIGGGSDFQLVELNNIPPEDWAPYYNGWDKNNTASPSGVGIHHPAGDAKKISTYTTNTVTSTPNIGGQVMASNSAWRVTWSATVNGHSVTMGGSSGSPLFNPDGLIIGTLTGGSSICNAPSNPDFYGKLSYSWASNGTSDATRLEPWLDPIGSGLTTLEGFDPYSVITPNFFANKLIINIEEEVTFFNTTFGGEPETFEWSFGLDAVPLTASGTGPHTVYYTSSGFKDVSLIINDSIVHTKEEYIYVREVRTATFHVTDQQGDPVENAMISVSPFMGSPRTSPVVKNFTREDTAEKTSSDNTIINEGVLSAKSFSPVMVNNSNQKNEDGEWIHWDSGENTNGIGTGDPANFSVASRWEPGDLTGLDQHVITSIKFFPRELNCEYTLKIWVGEDALEVYSQPVIDPAINTWNTIDLIDPFFFDNTQELWFGYYVNTQEGFPAGTDPGPQVGGKGNMILWNNNWVELSSLGGTLTFNWNLHAFVQPLPITEIYTNEDGQASFEDWEGTYNYMVEKENYQTSTGQFTMLGADVDVPVTLYDDDGKVTVTFMVDMGSANEFDPELHNVFLTGSLTEWAEPGTEGSIQLTRVNEDNNGNGLSTFTENFDGFDDFTTDLTPWINIDTHGNNTWGASGFTFPGEASPFGWKIMNPEETVPPIDNINPAFLGTNYVFSVASNPVPSTDAENKWLISPPMVGTEESVLSFYAKSITHQYGAERIKVYISITGTEPDDFELISAAPYLEVPLEWTEYTFDLAAYAGETIHFAVENVSNDAFMLFLDAFSVTNLEEGGDHVEDFYTATVRLEPGNYEYKYFSDAFGTGWDGGEWPGEPNRILEIEDHTTITDVWGDYTPDYQLTLMVNPDEAGVVSGAGIYLEGESVTVTATPEEDFIFVNWTEGENEVSTDAEYTFEMPGNDLTLTANFEAIPYYDLSLLVNPEEGGSVNGEGSYQAGTAVTVTANANENYVFLRWTNEGNITVSTDSLYSFTMPASHRTLTAHFDLENSVGDILAGEITIYPNPFNNNITIANATQVNRIKITNLMGQMVKYLDHNEGDIIQINTDDMPAGIYLIHCTTHEGTQKVSKIIKR